MNKIVTYITVVSMIFNSCQTDKKKIGQADKEIRESVQPESEAHLLLKNKCYICHNPSASSHDELIAPPMAAVKMRYSMSFESRDEFTDAMVSWVMDPREENALMIGAIDRFKVMPKQEFKQAEIEKIALYIFQNKLEEPAWFATHKKNMHGRGKGMGKGKGNP